jgi:hypothetical protein
MKNNDDIPATDTNGIKQLISRVKQGELDQGDAQLIEILLNFLLAIVSLLERKHTSIAFQITALTALSCGEFGRGSPLKPLIEGKAGREPGFRISGTERPRFENVAALNC